MIPNNDYSMKTIHDIYCVQRMFGHFMIVDHDDVDSTSNNNSVEKERHITGNCQHLNPMTKVVDLMDSCLAEVFHDEIVQTSFF